MYLVFVLICRRGGFLEEDLRSTTSVVDDIIIDVVIELGTGVKCTV